MSAQPNIISSSNDAEVLLPENDNQWQVVRDRSNPGNGKYYAYNESGVKELIGGFGVGNLPFGNDTNAAANTIQLSIPGAPVLQDGYIFEARILTTNTGDTSLQVNAQGVIQVTDTDGNALVGGELVNNEIYIFSYNATTGKYELLGLSKPAPSLPYKSYVALLTQIGTDAPTAVILQNELGQVPSLSYVDVGIYDIGVTGSIFQADKTFVVRGSGNGDDLGYLPYRKSNSSVRVLTYSDFEVTPANGILHSAPIEIRVYN